MPDIMESATTERRALKGTRVPLDLWIQLAHEDYEEPFDADGVDLSEGGLSLRADYLPEIGDRMRCRFESPPTGERIAVDGEVVWAHDAGERSGEFGLRFDDLGDELRESLQQLVGHLRGEASEVARLHLDGVSSPVEAEVLERDGRWLTVEQELPFLRMGMGVTVEQPEDAPRGRLASVDLRVVDGTPRLVLSVELDEPPALDAPVGTSEHTYDDDERMEVGAAQTLDEPSDATIQDFLPPDGGEFGPEEAEELALTPEPARRDAVQIFEVAHESEDDADEQHSFEARDSISAEEASPRSAKERLGAQLRPLWAKARAGLTTAKDKTRPALSAAWSKMIAFFALVRSKMGPSAKAAWAKVRALFAQLPRRKPKRRTTATPPKRRVAGAPRRQQRAEAAPVAPPRNRRKVIALSAVAFLGVGGTVYALTSADADAADGAAVETSAPPSTSAPAGLLAAPAAPSLPNTPQAEPATAGEPAAGEPTAAEPPAAAEPAPEPAGGRLSTPTFPSLRDADPTSAPVTEGQTFGASSVSDGRSATIRMSQPVTTLRGQPRDNGFTVTIPGALALDRAGPIAASNPSVERASVINLGDHAVLTVRFVSGRSPEYRVVARGRAIEIEIGR